MRGLLTRNRTLRKQGYSIVRMYISNHILCTTRPSK